MKCFLFFHKWGKYEPSQIATGQAGEPVVVQFRTCARCGARDARRVQSHN